MSHFLIYCYADHRDLHSFPTRRSSDLGVYGAPRLHTAAKSVGIQPHVGAEISVEGYGNLARPPRSEEHTSELQSHSDIVCRLLLEKKNVLNAYPVEIEAVRMCVWIVHV